MLTSIPSQSHHPRGDAIVPGSSRYRCTNCTFSGAVLCTDSHHHHRMTKRHTLAAQGGQGPGWQRRTQVWPQAGCRGRRQMAPQVWGSSQGLNTGSASAPHMHRYSLGACPPMITQFHLFKSIFKPSRADQNGWLWLSDTASNISFKQPPVNQSVTPFSATWGCSDV